MNNDQGDFGMPSSIIFRNRWVVESYLNIMLREYPNDRLLANATRTLNQIETYLDLRKERPFNVEELNRLIHLKEVIEFVTEADIAAIQHIDYAP